MWPGTVWFRPGTGLGQLESRQVSEREPELAAAHSLHTLKQADRIHKSTVAVQIRAGHKSVSQTATPTVMRGLSVDLCSSFDKRYESKEGKTKADFSSLHIMNINLLKCLGLREKGYNLQSFVWYGVQTYSVFQHLSDNTWTFWLWTFHF